MIENVGKFWKFISKSISKPISKSAWRGRRLTAPVGVVIATVVATLGLVSPADAWNETGHRIVAAVAYDHLTPHAKARVDDLIRRHPDYETILAKGAPADPAAKARAAFLVASYWPDTIRNDPRFYDDTRADAQPTPQLPGFPTMGRHTNWHYVDFNFSQDGTPVPPLETPNALTELDRIIGMIGGPASVDTAYALPWLLHLTGDIHNPLHTVSRYSRVLSKGDRGGNDVFVQSTHGRQNLHAFWDNQGGTDSSDVWVNTFASRIDREYKANKATLEAEISPKAWADEGFNIARKKVYKFSRSSGTKDLPVSLKKSYQNEAKKIASQRLEAAGLRLAVVLNRELQ